MSQVIEVVWLLQNWADSCFVDDAKGSRRRAQPDDASGGDFCRSDLNNDLEQRVWASYTVDLHSGGKWRILTSS